MMSVWRHTRQDRSLWYDETTRGVSLVDHVLTASVGGCNMGGGTKEDLKNPSI